MSADNYILVRKENVQWVGYMQHVSTEKVQYDESLFYTAALEDAISLAQEVDTEYGYRFEMAEVYKQGSPKIDRDGIREATFLHSDKYYAVPM